MAPYYQPGRFRVRVISQAFTEANTGTVQFVMKFKVLECVEPFNDSFASYERRIYFSLTEHTLPRVLSELRSLGSTARSLRELNPDNDGFFDFCGREIELWCSHEPDFHNPRELRERWSIRGGGERTLTNRKRLDELDRTLASKKKPNAGAMVPLAETDRDGVSDDDLPF